MAMPNYGGNSFPFTSAESGTAERLPIWIAIEERKSVGAVLMPDDTDNKVGTVYPLGTPIQFDPVGTNAPLLGSAATAPDGLLLCDVVMGEQGCTFCAVTRGKIRASLVQATITSAQKAALASRILFENEYVETRNS